MNERINEVPFMISCKDLDYLSDMFNWNYGAYKNTINEIKSVNDEEIKSILERGSNIFHSAMTKVLNILNNGGNNE